MQQKPYRCSLGMAKESLSGAGDVSLQRKVGGGIHGFGQSIHQLLNGTKVLAMSIAEVDEPDW